MTDPPYNADAFQLLINEVRGVREKIDEAERERLEQQIVQREFRQRVETTLDAIHDQAKMTNGRVTALELDRTNRVAVESMKARGWKIAAWAVGAVCTTVIAILAVSDHIA